MQYFAPVLFEPTERQIYARALRTAVRERIRRSYSQRTVAQYRPACPCLGPNAHLADTIASNVAMFGICPAHSGPSSATASIHPTCIAGNAAEAVVGPSHTWATGDPWVAESLRILTEHMDGVAVVITCHA